MESEISVMRFASDSSRLESARIEQAGANAWVRYGLQLYCKEMSYAAFFASDST
jgi:hypothetical protein